MQHGKNFLKVNDQVEVITGKDKGRVGKILRVDKKSDRALPNPAPAGKCGAGSP